MYRLSIVALGLFIGLVFEFAQCANADACFRCFRRNVKCADVSRTECYILPTAPLQCTCNAGSYCACNDNGVFYTVPSMNCPTCPPTGTKCDACITLNTTVPTLQLGTAQPSSNKPEHLDALHPMKVKDGKLVICTLQESGGNMYKGKFENSKVK